jgi:hypothetical protein
MLEDKMSKQTDAMRLADKLEDVALNAYVIEPAVAELRRLESVNAQLLEALIVMVDNFGSTSSDDVHGLGEARAAITKATGEAK